LFFSRFSFIFFYWLVMKVETLLNFCCWIKGYDLIWKRDGLYSSFFYIVIDKAAQDTVQTRYNETLNKKNSI